MSPICRYDPQLYLGVPPDPKEAGPDEGQVQGLGKSKWKLNPPKMEVVVVELQSRKR